MRLSTVVCGGLCICLSSAAVAESPAELQAKGEDLAKQGRFTEAIDAFKAADKIEPSATHACLIALAYTRRELWPQAEIWLAQCQVRATAKDPLPEWAPAEQDQINQRLAAANVAPVEIKVEPVDAGAKLTVSSFAPDEQFSPRTIHLPPGLHTIRATAPGYEPAEKQIEIKDKGAQVVVLTLHKPGDGTPLPAGPAKVVHSNVPLYVMGAGAAIGVVGVGLHLFYYKPKLDTLTKYSKDGSMPDSGMYQNALGPWQDARNLTIGVYVGAAVTIGVGVVLKYTAFKDHEESAPAVGFAPVPGGGMVSLGFSR